LRAAINIVVFQAFYVTVSFVGQAKVRSGVASIVDNRPVWDDDNELTVAVKGTHDVLVEVWNQHYVGNEKIVGKASINLSNTPMSKKITLELSSGGNLTCTVNLHAPDENSAEGRLH
jgi:hypothetical protein